ncbi:MAG: DNA adenine methylase [Campylobacteraceae bacterium]|nr:DNA adenine methylase [Campylobacteraceae bacterium]
MTHAPRKNTFQPKPFVKWAGGKRGLLNELLKRIPKDFSSYFEPFVGGGALFFEMKKQGLLNGKQIYLSDKNKELINAYNVIKKCPQKLLNELLIFSKEHSKEFYYYVRGLDKNTDFERFSDEYRAARFIYLNKTCFNGLYRVNQKGFFNVPAGSYKNPQICSEELIFNAHEALQNANILCGCYTKISKLAQKGDFVYFDPPYYPINKTSSFTSYDKDGFLENEQKELAGVFKAMAQKGCFALESNSDTEFIKELYKEFFIEFIKADRYINCKGSGRGKIQEVLINGMEAGSEKQ